MVTSHFEKKNTRTPDYPYVGEYNGGNQGHKGLKVMFTDFMEGVVVYCPTGSYSTGDYRDDWHEEKVYFC